MSLNKLATQIFQANADKGFWDDRIVIPSKMEQSRLFTPEEIESVKKAYKGQQLMLIVSELSEALEADRKDLKDDKLPEYNGIDVELVDAEIRILDYMGAYGINNEEILKKKLEYNATRPFKHGKKY